MTPFEIDAVADWHDEKADFSANDARKHKNDPDKVFELTATAERHDDISFRLRKVAKALRA